jgi:hypothetical protein
MPEDLGARASFSVSGTLVLPENGGGGASPARAPLHAPRAALESRAAVAALGGVARRRARDFARRTRVSDRALGLLRPPFVAV